jgi:hypothetical protein
LPLASTPLRAGGSESAGVSGRSGEDEGEEEGEEEREEEGKEEREEEDFFGGCRPTALSASLLLSAARWPLPSMGASERERANASSRSSRSAAAIFTGTPLLLATRFQLGVPGDHNEDDDGDNEDNEDNDDEAKPEAKEEEECC